MNRERSGRGGSRPQVQAPRGGGFGGRPAPAYRRPVAALTAALALSITVVAAEPAPLRTNDWPVAAPESQGLDAARIDRLVELIERDRAYPDIHGLLVVRHGYLVVEKYFHGFTADDLHQVQSVTKSVTSAAMGVAIERGIIKGVHEHVLDFYKDLEGIENVDDRKQAITIEDLLTMRSGTDYHERGPGSPHYELNALPAGWDKFVLSRPMVHDPGTFFQYDSGGVILISSMIKARSGDHADVLIAEHIFKPLGIEKFWWHRNLEGQPHTGGGLMLRPRDMAKFGLLYLREGKWGDEQVLPASWVEASVKRHADATMPDGRSSGYGYLWWLFRPDPDGAGEQDIWAACGFRAQFIFVVPEHDMVVVVTGGTKNTADMVKPIDFLYRYILKAVKR